MEQRVYALRTPVRVSGIQCGEEACAPGYAFGPCIRDYWLVHYVKAGRGVFRIHGKNYPVQAGEVFFIPPNVNTYYAADMDDPWEYQWLGIYGEGLEAVYTAAGLTDRDPVQAVDQAVLERLLARERNGLPWGLLSDTYAFLEAISCQSPAPLKADALYVQEAEEYIRRSLYKKVTVAEVAAYLNIDRSYLTALFKKHRGVSTQQFILQVKLAAAKTYLATTGYSVARIARSVGYDDAFVFSHAFKKECGISPSAFREKSQRT